MKMTPIELQHKYIAPTYGFRGLTIVRGEGIYLFDQDGKRYVDCFANYGVNIFGHNVNEINNAVITQLSRLTNLHGSFANDVRSEFAKKLVDLAPEKSTKIFFCNSGAEAIEAAIKFVRLATNKKEIIAAQMGYHGKTMGALSLTRTLPKYSEPFLPLLENIKHFSYNDIDSLKEVISEKTAAVFLEPIQGESGIRIPSPSFFKEVRKICDQNGALLVIDEIQTFGRTGKLFAIDDFEIQPDILCLAKGLAGGVPIGATLVTDDVSEKLFSGCHSNTFGGNPLVCAAGIAALDYYEQNKLSENAQIVGKYFLDELRKLNSPIVREIRGKGMMIAVELKTRMTKYAKALQDNGVIVIPTGANILRLLPPVTFTKENVDEIISIFEMVLK